MTQSHRRAVLLSVTLIVLIASLTGCVSSKQQSFRMSFLPATPIPAGQAIEEPPAVSFYDESHRAPNMVDRALSVPQRAPEVDGRIFKAESYFDLGKKLYQQGDLAAARREFDSAMDVLLSAPENMPDRYRLEHKLEQLAEIIYRYDLEGLGAGKPQEAVVYDKSPLDDILEMTFPTDPNLRPKVKEEIAATVSQLPLQENDAVLSYIHYFSTDRGHKVLVNGLRRAGRYRSLIQRILDEEGIPQELIYLAQVESGFLPRAKSYKAAVGMWQFVQFRGREYGLNQSPTTDDRMDPEKATRAAAKHLHDLYTLFGDWYLAMAAYNCGPNCVDHAVQRTGYADFWQLSSHNALPKQTENYVPLILAVTIMAKNPKDYNLENLDVDPAVEYETIDIVAPTHLGLIADAADRPISEFQDLNPSLLKPVAPEGFQLRVPKGTGDPIRCALVNVPPNHRDSWRIHRVTSGETLAEIARHYSVSSSSILGANSHLAETPEKGDLLVIPAGYHVDKAARTAATHGKVTAHAKKVPTKRSATAHHSAPATTHRSTVSYKTASVSRKRSTATN